MIRLGKRGFDGVTRLRLRLRLRLRGAEEVRGACGVHIATPTTPNTSDPIKFGL